MNHTLIIYNEFFLNVVECVYLFHFFNELFVGFFSKVAVDFFAANPRQTNENRDILFHFNPRPPNTLVLNTFLQNGWQEEVYLKDDEFNTKLIENPFKLTIKVTDAEDTPKQMTAFGVFVNDAFLTTYLCPADITMASFIGFTPNLRISANIEDF